MKNILTERCIVQKETYICVVWLKSGQKNKKKAFFALSLVRSLENFKQGGWRQCSAHSISACTRQAFAMPIHNFTAWEYCLLIHPCKVFPDTRIRWIENKSHAYFVLNLKIYITHRRQRELYSGKDLWVHNVGVMRSKPTYPTCNSGSRGTPSNNSCKQLLKALTATLLTLRISP